MFPIYHTRVATSITLFNPYGPYKAWNSETYIARRAHPAEKSASRHPAEPRNIAIASIQGSRGTWHELSGILFHVSQCVRYIVRQELRTTASSSVTAFTRVCSRHTSAIETGRARQRRALQGHFEALKVGRRGGTITIYFEKCISIQHMHTCRL